MKSSFLRKGITLLVFVVGCWAGNTIQGQITGWVFFKDKGAPGWNPEDVFTQEALQRRSRLGVQFNIDDQPVSARYIEEVKLYADSLHGSSKWLNGIVITCSNNNWNRISRLSFVSTIDTSASDSNAMELCAVDLKKDTLSNDQITSIKQDSVRHSHRAPDRYSMLSARRAPVKRIAQAERSPRSNCSVVRRVTTS